MMYTLFIIIPFRSTFATVMSLAFETLEICWVSLSTNLAASYTSAVVQLHLKSVQDSFLKDGIVAGYFSWIIRISNCSYLTNSILNIQKFLPEQFFRIHVFSNKLEEFLILLNFAYTLVKRHFCGAPSDVGFATEWTWLHSVALDSLITPSFKSASTCFLISFCFSSECLRGGWRLHGSRHLSSLITIFFGSTASGSRRTLVANTSINSWTKARSLV